MKVSNDLKTFQVNQKAMSILRSIDGEIGVVAIAGAQRTGKSFILNLILDKLNDQGVRILAFKHCIVQNKPNNKELYLRNMDMGLTYIY